jgi:rhamnosyl/mannosyltransferase
LADYSDKKGAISKEGLVKILHLGKYYYPFTGGIETVTRDICEGMVSKGHEVTVLCSNDKNRTEKTTINGVDVIYSSRLLTFLSQPINLFLAFTLASIVKKFDVVHVHSPNPFAELLALFIPKNIKVVTTHHADVTRQKAFLLFYKHLYKAFLKRCDKIYVATENHIKYSSFLPEFESKCEIIPFTINEKRFETSDYANKLKESIKLEHGPYCLFVGRLVSYKGLDYLIDAAKSIKGNIVLVGGGPDRDRLEQRLFDERIENVKILGKVMDDDYFAALYHAANFMILPSITKAENFGVVQLEAMYCRKPMITTNIKSGVPIVGKHNETTFIIEPEDSKAIAEKANILFENEDLCREMGLNGMKRFFKFYTREKFNEAHHLSYLNLLGIEEEIEEIAA